jgi:hypothetical protein
MMGNKPRRYGDKEVGQILKRASELQADTGSQSGSESGLTVEELERIAGEVGIESKHIRAAAADLDEEPADTPGFNWAGGASNFQVERICEGEIGPEAWEEMVAEIRRHTNRPGTVGQTGVTHEWTGGFDVSSLAVTVTPRNGQTRIRFMAQYGGGVGLTWIVGSMVPLMASLIAGKGMNRAGVDWSIIAMVTAAIFFVCIIAARIVAKTWTEHDARKLRSLADRLEGIARDHTAAPSQVGAGQAADVSVRHQSIVANDA